MEDFEYIDEDIPNNSDNEKEKEKTDNDMLLLI